MTNKVKEKFEISKVNEEYMKMYHCYFVLRWSQYEICKYFNCSKTKVTNAMKWVIENKVKIPSEYLLKGAVDSVIMRLQKNKELYDQATSKKRYKDTQFIIALSKEIREDERMLYKLQEVYQGEEEDEDNKLNTSQVLKLIMEAKKK